METPGLQLHSPVHIQGAWSLALAVGLSVALLLPAAAHDSPEHVAEQLTLELQREGRSAERLCERATQYRELGRLAEAESDLAGAIQMDPGNLAAVNDLARVQLHRGHASNALATLARAIGRAASDGERSPLLLTRAEIYSARGEPALALQDCDRAFAATATPDLDWYLLRAQLQLQAKQPAAAAAGLKAGFDQTGSAVLEAEWIDALLDAGQPREVMPRIEHALADSRWRSSWLLRRGRARLELNDAARARGDFHAAIRELDARLEGALPDPTLYLDRGLAYALLGDTEAARRDLAAARAGGIEPAFTWRLESRLSARP